MTVIAILIGANTSLLAAESSHFSPYADLTINTHWDSNYQDMEPMDLATISQASGVTHFHLAFITDAGACNPAWGSQTSYSTNSAWGSHLTDKLRSSHIDFIISFGGASGNDISMACTDTQLVNAYEQIIKTYQPKGLDFDIENGTANVAKTMHALQQIQTNHPDLKISFTLPTLPEGLTAEGQSVVTQAKAANLHFSINIMAMDYGPSYTDTMGKYAIQAATNLFGFLKSLYPNLADNSLWQMIEITPMIGVNDVSVEEFKLTDADVLREFFKQNKLGGLSMWSITRDIPCKDKWASPICSGNNLQSQPYEFSKHLLE